MSRAVFNMNFDWQFFDGDIEYTGFECVHDHRFKSPIWLKAGNCGVSKWGFDVSEWEDIQIPHDFRVARGEFDPENVPAPQGYYKMGIVWYRKEFFVDKSIEGQSIFLEFDGVYRDSEIYVNGHFVGRHLSGYTSFDVEIADVVLYGQPNVVALRLNATNYEGWWYEAAGMYRDVRLVYKNPVYIPQDGVFVRGIIDDKDCSINNEELSVKKALIKADIELSNLGSYSGGVDVEVNISLDEELVMTKNLEIQIEAYKPAIINLSEVMTNPVLWDIDHPKQYNLEVKLMLNHECLDEVNVLFGIKHVEFSPNKGVILNGRAIKIQGVCVHDDFAAVGGAMTESVLRHKIQILKDMGCNAYRCSHNPPSPYLFKACDELGILVMDEVRLMSTADEYIEQMTDTMKRDRNHASIFIWSIGNEEMNIHGTPTGIKIMKRLQRLSHELDETRPATYANNANWNEITRYHEENGFSIDVFGFNYYVMRDFDLYDDIHRDFPDRCILGTENGSGQSTRGQYFPREEEQDRSIYHDEMLAKTIWANPKREFNVSAYTETYPLWGSDALETIKAADKDYVAGYFVWTGFDYRGETFPFQWPSVITRYGIVDLCGFLKDSGHQYQVHWRDEPAIHLMPHWTFDRVGEEIEVVITSNTDEIEFIINGQSQGRELMERYGSKHYFVTYEPGEIIAIGYNKGAEVVRQSHKTASNAVAIELEVTTKAEPLANGEDHIMVKAYVVDKDGLVNLDTDNRIQFSVEGVGEIVGCGNGDPLSHEHELNDHRTLFNGLALVAVRTTRKTGTIILKATGEGLESKTIEIQVKKEATDQVAPSIKDLDNDVALETYDTKDAADGGL